MPQVGGRACGAEKLQLTLNCAGPLTHRLFSINVVSIPYEFLSDIFFSLVYCDNTLCVPHLFMLLAKFLANSRGGGVKFWGNQSYTQIFGCLGVGTRTPVHYFLGKDKGPQESCSQWGGTVAPGEG